MGLSAKLTALLFTLTALTTISCRTVAATRHPTQVDGPRAAHFSDVANRDWGLLEIRTASQTVALDRDRLAAEFGPIFTLRLEGALVRGRAAPNVYDGSFALKENQEIRVGPLRTTRIATSVQPEELTEHRFITYLYNAFMWNLTEGKLELHTTSEDGAETVLRFAPMEPEPPAPGTTGVSSP